MNRSSLLLAAITLTCGTVIGWGGATLLGRFHNETDAPVESPAVATFSVPSPSAETEGMAVISDAREPDVQMSIELPDRRRIPAMVVGVNGAVRRPGVYEFEENARVKDGITAAGGATEEADLDDINIAARLLDNTSLYVPFKVFRHQEQHALVARRTLSAAESNPARYTRSGWTQGMPATLDRQQDVTAAAAPSISPAVSSAAPVSGLINLNTATLDELQRLPGVGPKTAEKIDAYRTAQPFRTVDELEAVQGIGEKRMAALRDLVTVE